MTADATLHPATVPASPLEARPSPVARATGVELLGAYQGSGEHRAPQLARLADGRVVQLTPVLHAIVEAADGRRGPAEIAEVLAEDHPDLDVETVRHLVDEHLRPGGLVVGVDGSTTLPERTDPLTALRLRRAAIAPERVRRWARPLVPLMAWPLIAAALVAFAALEFLLLVDGRLTGALTTTFTEPGAFFGVLALTLAGAAFHELGHAAALRAGGGEPGEMGVGLYLVWPAFYTDVTDAYRLSRRDRLRVDIAGLHCNALFTIGLLAVWTVTGSPLLIAAALFQGVQALQQLLPVVRFDGYYLASDLAGVPDLFLRLPDLLRSLVPGSTPTAKIRGLTRRARVIATAWVVGVVAVVIAVLVRLVFTGPAIVSATVARVDDRLAAAGAAVDAGAFGTAASQATSALIACFVPAGLVYIAFRLVTRAGRGASRRLRGSRRGRRPPRAVETRARSATATPDPPVAPDDGLEPHERRRFAHVATLADPDVYDRPVPRPDPPMTALRIQAPIDQIERQLHEPLALAVALAATVGTGAAGRALRCPTVTMDGRRLQPAQVVRKRTSRPGVTTFHAVTAAGEAGWLDVCVRSVDGATGVFVWFDGPEPVARIWDRILDAVRRLDAGP